MNSHSPPHAVRLLPSLQNSQVVTSQPVFVQLLRSRARQFGSSLPQPQSNSLLAKAGSVIAPHVQPEQGTKKPAPSLHTSHAASVQPGVVQPLPPQSGSGVPQ